MPAPAPVSGSASGYGSENSGPRSSLTQPLAADVGVVLGVRAPVLAFDRQFRVRRERLDRLQRADVAAGVDQQDRPDGKRMVHRGRGDEQVVHCRGSPGRGSAPAETPVVAVDLASCRCRRDAWPTAPARRSRPCRRIPSACTGCGRRSSRSASTRSARLAESSASRGAVAVDAVQHVDRQAIALVAQHAPLAARRGEADPAVGQVAGMEIVGVMPVDAGRPCTRDASTWRSAPARRADRR